MPKFHTRFGLKTMFALTAVVAMVVWSLLRFFSTEETRLDFSPDTLEFIRHKRRVIWFTDVPITRSQRPITDPQTTGPRQDLIKYLIAHGYWEMRSTSSPTWITTDQWRTAQSSGSQSLTATWLIDQSDSWIRWTEKHPELAQTVWPLVLDLLRTQSDFSQIESDLKLVWIFAQTVESQEKFLRRLNGNRALKKRAAVKSLLLEAEERLQQNETPR